MRGERAVMGAGYRFLGKIVERAGEALRHLAAVDEEDGGVALADDFEQARVDCVPDGDASRSLRGRAARNLLHGVEARHVFDGDFNAELEQLARAGVDDGDGPIAQSGLIRHVGGPGVLPCLVLRCARWLDFRSLGPFVPWSLLFRSLYLHSAEEAGYLFQWSLGGRKPDSLRRLLDQRLKPFERDGEMRAALGGDQRVDFIDDHRVDGAEYVCGLRGQQKVERLGRGDEDVGGVAQVPCSLSRGRVSGADADSRLVERYAAAAGHVRDAGQRRA